MAALTPQVGEQAFSPEALTWGPGNSQGLLLAAAGGEVGALPGPKGRVGEFLFP